MHIIVTYLSTPNSEYSQIVINFFLLFIIGMICARWSLNIVFFPAHRKMTKTIELYFYIRFWYDFAMSMTFFYGTFMTESTAESE